MPEVLVGFNRGGAGRRYLEFGRVVLQVQVVLPVPNLRGLVPLAVGGAADGGVPRPLGSNEAFGQRRHALTQRV